VNGTVHMHAPIEYPGHAEDKPIASKGSANSVSSAEHASGAPLSAVAGIERQPSSARRSMTRATGGRDSSKSTLSKAAPPTTTTTSPATPSTGSTLQVRGVGRLVGSAISTASDSTGGDRRTGDRTRAPHGRTAAAMYRATFARQSGLDALRWLSGASRCAGRAEPLRM